VSLLWLLTPILPLLWVPLIMRWPRHAIPLNGICLLPALLAVILAPPALTLPGFWPGALWGQDGVLASSLLGLSASLWLLAGLFASHSMRQDKKRLRFWLYWQLSLSGNLLLLIAADALSFYVGFSMMSLSAYGLIVHQGGPQPRRAARLYLQLTITGELVLFTGLIMASHQAGGSLLLSDWQLASMSTTTLLLLFLGLGLKAGFWPLHVWLPEAHPAAPAPASAVLSGVMIKAGIFGMWQLMPHDSSILQGWVPILIAIALFSAVYGALMGLTRTNVKSVLAYSSVSQMGYLLLITALLWQQPGQYAALAVLLALYAVHHGFCKGALFMAAELVKQGRPASLMAQRLLLGLLALPALAIAGLPLTSGGAVKTMLKEQVALAGFEQLILPLQLAAITSALVMFRAWLLLRSMQQKASIHPIARTPLISWAMAALLCVGLPWLWPTMREALWLSLPGYKVAELAWPLLIGILLATIAVARRWQLPEQLARQQSPALRLSLLLRRLLQHTHSPPSTPTLRPQHVRGLERQWNRFWASGTVMVSSWLLGVFMLIAWLMTGLAD